MKWRAVSKRLERDCAVLFPALDGHVIPAIANLFADRSWVADFLGVPTADLLVFFQDAVRRPVPWIEVTDAPVQEVVHRDIALLE